jgi:hypothetical protein
VQCTFVVAGVIAIVPAIASADPTEAARISAEAEKLAAAGSFLDAAARFRQAYAADPRPDLLCNVGIAFHKGKDLPRAHLYLGQCLQRAGSLDAEIAAQVRAVVASIEAQLRAGEFAPVDIAVSPDTASFTVSAFGDGDRVIGTQLVWLPIGNHTLTVRADGYIARSETIAIPDRDPLQVDVDLVPAPKPKLPERDPPRRSHAPAITATAATAVVGGGSLVLYLVARSTAKSAGEVLPGDEYDDRVSRAKLLRNLSIAGGALAVGGAVVSALLWRRAGEPLATRVEVGATEGGAGAWVSGTF